MRVNHPDISQKSYQQSFEINQTNIIDNFEDDDLSEYSTNIPSNGTATIQSGTVKNGTYALEIKGENGGSVTRIGSTSGLPTYPEPPVDFNFYLYHEGGESDVQFYWCVLDENNIRSDAYLLSLQIGAAGKAFNLTKKSGGTSTGLDVKPLDEIYKDEWIRINVTHKSGDIDAVAYDSADNVIGRLQGSDSTFTTGGIGIIHNTGNSPDSPAYIDNARTEASSVSVSETRVFDNIIFWWPLSAGTGSTVRDVSGASNWGGPNNGAVNGTYSWNTSEGVWGNKSISSDGSNTRIEGNWGNGTSGDVSGGAWVKANQVDDIQSILDPYDGNNYNFTVRINDSDDIILARYDGRKFDILTESFDSYGEWKHLFGVYDETKSDLILYVDGSDVESINTSLGSITNNSNYWACSLPQKSGNVLDGLISDVRMFNRPLGPSEVQTIYDNTKNKIS